MRSGQRFSYLVLDPEETRALNAADPEAFIEKGLELLASDRYFEKGTGLDGPCRTQALPIRRKSTSKRPKHFSYRHERAQENIGSLDRFQGGYVDKMTSTCTTAVGKSESRFVGRIPFLAADSHWVDFSFRNIFEFPIIAPRAGESLIMSYC